MPGGTQGPELLRREPVHPLAGAGKDGCLGYIERKGGRSTPQATPTVAVTGMCERVSLPFTCVTMQPDRHGPVLPLTR